jgi:hypothetical protein
MPHRNRTRINPFSFDGSILRSGPPVRLLSGSTYPHDFSIERTTNAPRMKAVIDPHTTNQVMILTLSYGNKCNSKRIIIPSQAAAKTEIGLMDARKSFTEMIAAGRSTTNVITVTIIAGPNLMHSIL